MTNKILLGLIAAGLWANAIAIVVMPARADSDSSLRNIDHDIHAIYAGTCKNAKLCGTTPGAPIQ